jgi:hypothetical protein
MNVEANRRRQDRHTTTTLQLFFALLTSQLEPLNITRDAPSTTLTLVGGPLKRLKRLIQVFALVLSLSDLCFIVSVSNRQEALGQVEISIDRDMVPSSSGFPNKTLNRHLAGIGLKYVHG